MRKNVFLAFLLVFLLGLGATANATIIDFENLNPGGSASAAIPSGYAGFNWSTGATWYTESYAVANAPGSGFVYGVDGQVAAYGANLDHAITLTSSSPFNFLGVMVTAAYSTPLGITIEGWLGATKIYTSLFNVNNTTPTFISTDFENIDKLVFVPEAVGQNAFAIDNINYSAVPVPPSILLFGSGIIGITTFKLRKLLG